MKKGSAILWFVSVLLVLLVLTVSNEYIESRSTRKKGTEEFEKQVKNIAATFAQGKIALLRELGTIKNKRGDYTVTGDIEARR